MSLLCFTGATLIYSWRLLCRIIQAAAIQLIDFQTLRMRWQVGGVGAGEPKKPATDVAVVVSS